MTETKERFWQRIERYHGWLKSIVKIIYSWAVYMATTPIRAIGRGIDYTWHNKRELLVLLSIAFLAIAFTPLSATWVLPNDYGQSIDQSIESTVTAVSSFSWGNAPSSNSPDSGSSAPATTDVEWRYNGPVSTAEAERLMVDLVNDKRAGRGMTSLTWNDRVARTAQSHADDMAQNDYFSHTSRTGVTQRERYSFCSAGGENIAKTWIDRRVKQDDGSVVRYDSSTDLAQGIVNQWMNSRAHRENGIYGFGWRMTGVGIAIRQDGAVYAVMGFCG